MMKKLALLLLILICGSVQAQTQDCALTADYANLVDDKNIAPRESWDHEIALNKDSKKNSLVIKALSLKTGSVMSSLATSP